MENVNNRIQEPPFALPFDTIIHGKYRIQEVLGFGGFGITYKGEDLTDQKKVAVKEFYPSGLVTRMPGTTFVELGSGYEQYVRYKENFIREARIIYHCDNPHILNIFSLFEENNTAYYVMEFLEGEDLRKYLADRGGRIGWEELKPFCLQVMDALSDIHREGVIHRDISPDNIYLSNTQAKLIDFGAARSLGGDKSVSVILKKGYAPPEQYETRGRHGPWTDVYALGGTLYRCLTGEMPEESIERLRNDTLKVPSSYGVSLPREVDMAIMKAMNLNERDRFQSIEEFRRTIDPNERRFGKTIFGRAIPKLFESFTVRISEGRSSVKKSFSGAVLPENNRSLSLVCLEGIYAAQSFPLDQDIIIGRDPYVCSIIFPEGTPGVSGVHCQICLNSFGMRAALIDCDSSFGTFHNGVRITAGVPQPLTNGDLIQIGAGNTFQVFI
ncbi:MAG: protein kinase [Lachnospiraceae bacterium]|nr:protein kinase [Lachnospiraceae bacterium]